MSTSVAVTKENHEKCREVYRLREQEGKGSTTISREVGISEATVKRWLSNPTYFDPHLDEVALHRAMEGDRKVYLNLTYWERPEFFRRLARIRCEVGYAWRWYIGTLAELLGVDTDHLTKNVGIHDERD